MIPTATGIRRTCYNIGMRVCSVDGCETKAICRGWCGTHYHNWLRRGRPEPSTVAERFAAKVDRRGPDDCWEWTGFRNRGGYGVGWDGERKLGAHRLAYLLEHGSIPDGLQVCHTCDNRGCVNPAHLWAGSRTQNQHDMGRKGRGRAQLDPSETHDHEDWYYSKDGKRRYCRPCVLAAQRRYRERKKLSN